MLLALRSLWEAATSSSGGILPNWQLIHRYLRQGEPAARGDATLHSARARAHAGNIVAIGASVAAAVSAACHARAGKIRAAGVRIALLQNARAVCRASIPACRGAAIANLIPAPHSAFRTPHLQAKGARNFTNEELIALLLAA